MAINFSKVFSISNKSLISINGTSLMRIVDTDMLTDEDGNFKTPVGTLTRGNQIFTAGDLDRESLFSVDSVLSALRELTKIKA